MASSPSPGPSPRSSDAAAPDTAPPDAEDMDATTRSTERRIADGLLQALPGIGALVDLDGRLYRWNEALEAQAARPPERGTRLAPVLGLAPERLQRLLHPACTDGSANREFALRIHGETVPHTLRAQRIDTPTQTFLAVTGVDVGERVAARRALREREQQYALIANHVVDVISRHRPDSTCLYVSPSIEALLGVTPEEVVGTQTNDLLHPDDRARVEAATERTLQGATAQERVRLRHAEGHYVWVEVTGRLRRNDAGAPVDIVTVTRDVTDRVQAEEALRESEIRFRQLAENVEGVFWLRTRDEILYVSPAYERIWGRSCQSLYDDPASYAAAIHPEDRADVRDAVDRAWDTNTSYHGEYRVVQPDGTVRWVRAMSQRVPVEDGIDRHAGYAVDVTARKRQEEALRQSEERWRRLVERHMEPIMITVEGTIRYVNPSGARLFAAPTPKALIGRSVFDFVAADYHPEVRDRVDRLQAGEATVPFEHRMERLDGEVRIVESYSVPIRYDGEHAAQTVLRDITEWRRTQSKLEYRILLENLIVDLSTSLIDTGADRTDATLEDALGRIGPFVGADRSYVFLFDHEAQTLTNTHEWCAPGIEPQMHKIQAMPQAELPWMMEQLQQLHPVHVPDVDALPPEAASLQAALLDQDVESMVIVPMTEGRTLMGFVGFDAVRQPRTWARETIMLLRVLGDTFANALARKEAEQALRTREAQYRTVVENVRDIVFQIDADGCWRFLNPAWEAVTGYAVDESLGTPCTDVLALDDPEGEAKDVRDVLLDGGAAPLRTEVRLRTATGASRWMALFSQPITDDDGALTGVAGTLHDITERKRMETKTREALRRERELNQLKSSFVSMVSHEFRTPLATLRSSSEMLARYVEQWSANKREKHITRMHTQIDRMSRLLGDVITTSKLDAQHEEPVLHPIALQPFTRDAIDEVRAHVQTDHPIEVTADAVPDAVTADRDLLQHIFVNLLSNACKYSPEDAPVEVTWRREEEMLVLSVSDAGIGIPDADVPNVFEAFYRADNVGNADGSGLGMTIVKRAVDVYGGSVEVASAEGEGTTFTVRLPSDPTLGADSDRGDSSESGASGASAPSAAPPAGR